MIRGVAGIGKSSLAAKACEKLKGSHNAYWHQIRPWDTRPSVLAGIGEFLAAIGRPGLRAVLARGEAARADSVLRDDLLGAPCVLVFDDAHEAIPEVLDLLRFLKDAIADAPDARARKRLATIAKKLGGHPLFVELLRSAPARGIAAPSLTDVRRFIEEEIYTELSEGERRMMKTAALYAVPFPREAAFVDPSLSHDVFLALTTKSLIRPMGEDAFGVHDTIRDFFTSILTESERKTLGPAAIEQLLRIADVADASKDFVAALNALSNALELATSRERHASLSERLGDAYERLGDLPAAMAAYAEAMRHVDEPESLARLHRKVATTLQVRGENARAAVEIEAGFKALDERASVERGRLNLQAGRVAAARRTGRWRGTVGRPRWRRSGRWVTRRAKRRPCSSSVRPRSAPPAPDRTKRSGTSSARSRRSGPKGTRSSRSA
ncbi:MAG: ATP-binding protein [Methanobacteriota archaeon]|nr:MAG: ATP-binding protein [Euryarchaeota archaeon]